MLKLFDKHNIPASFYIPAVAAMMHPAMIEEIKKRSITRSPSTGGSTRTRWRSTIPSTNGD